VLPGVNIELHGVSDNPVQLSVTRTSDDLVDTVQKYVDGFNEVVDGLAELTKYDADTNTRGLLMGDATAQGVEQALYEGLTQVVNGAGKYRVLADVGISIGDESRLEFDEDKFREAYADDPTAVQNLFAAVDKITETKTTTGGILTNGVAADGTLINYVVTGGTTVTTTTTNGATVTTARPTPVARPRPSVG
jgi:flagellar capping protein FliD